MVARASPRSKLARSETESPSSDPGSLSLSKSCRSDSLPGLGEMLQGVVHRLHLGCARHKAIPTVRPPVQLKGNKGVGKGFSTAAPSLGMPFKRPIGGIVMPQRYNFNARFGQGQTYSSWSKGGTTGLFNRATTGNYIGAAANKFPRTSYLA